MNYIRSHVVAIRSCANMLFNSTFNSILTISAIAISICLPSCFYLITQQFTDFQHEWNTSSKITVYLESTIEEDQVAQVTQLIKQHKNIKNAQVLTPTDVWKQISEDLEIDEDLSQSIFDSGSPIPNTILITPNTTKLKNKDDIKQLKQWVESIPEVEYAQLDLQWVESVRSFSQVIEKIILSVGLVLIIGMVLIISNSIKAEISKQERMVKVQFLCGLSYTFIKRPFLYLGFAYGLLGATLALIILVVIINYIGVSSAIINNINTSTHFSFFILSLGCFTGWIASLWSIKFHVNHLQKE